MKQRVLFVDDEQSVLDALRQMPISQHEEWELTIRVRQRTEELQQSCLELIWRLAQAAEKCDEDSANHVVRVGCLSRVIAEGLGMDHARVETISLAAPLHDIGKMAVPDAILRKPGRLDPDEWRIMTRHCEIGERILREDPRIREAFQRWNGNAVPQCGARSPLLTVAGAIALSHHERWDGQGYPHGLSGEAIPLEARIVAVADVFDALLSRRPYKAPFPIDQALEIIRDQSGTHFDPAVCRVFFDSLPAILAIGAEFAEEPVIPPVPIEECADAAHPVCG